jgi:hypothetical protein
MFTRNNLDPPDPELIPLIEERIVRARDQLTRQGRAVRKTRGDLHHAIRDGFQHGASPTRMAQLSGLHVSRIYQIRDNDDAVLE